MAQSILSASTPAERATILARNVWAFAQTCDIPLRWNLEGHAYRVWKRWHGEASLNYFSALMTDQPGWAFACGFTVHWYPTKGIAKHQHTDYWREYGANRCGSLQRCSLAEAVHWEQGGQL